MSFNDSIADMLTRIRNAAKAKFPKVTMPHTKVNEALARIIADEGFLNGVDVVGEGKLKSIVIDLKYGDDGKPVFSRIERTSKLGCRRYVMAKDIRPTRQGMGVAIVSTSKGIMKDMDARRQNVGGEVLCTIW